jgi:peptide/nickel transport system permease protein
MKWARPLISIAVKRLAFSTAVVFGAVSVIFVLFSLVPGDATDELLGLQSDPTVRAELSRNLALDRPLGERYMLYLGRLVRGNLGRSLTGLGEIRQLLFERLSYTLPLVLAAAGVSIALGLIFALALAWIDSPRLYHFADAASLTFASLPIFITALALTVSFGRGRAVPIMYDGTWWSAILPVVALSLGPTFWVVRIISTDLQRILKQNFILFRRGLGLPKSALLLTALQNVSVLTTLGVNLLLALLMGTFFVEYAFNWPGMGQLLVYSLLRRDVPVVQGVVLCFAVIIMLADTFVETWRQVREHT